MGDPDVVNVFLGLPTLSEGGKECSSIGVEASNSSVPDGSKVDATGKKDV